MSKVRTKSFSHEEGVKLLGFLKNAYEDYLASRTLLNHNLIVQGAILANTAIEKYFKAILTFKGDSVKHTHSINGMLPSIKNYDKPLYDKLDIDLLAELISVIRLDI